MATLTAQEITRAGLEMTTAAAAAGGDEFANTGREFIYINNASVGDITLTVVTTATVDGLAVADRTVVVTAGEARFVGPFSTAHYGSTTSLTYSGVTTLTVAILYLTTA